MMRGPGCTTSELRTFGGRRDQRLDELVPETDDFVRTHVAADHSVRQPRLERLVDDAPPAAK